MTTVTSTFQDWAAIGVDASEGAILAAPAVPILGESGEITTTKQVQLDLSAGTIVREFEPSKPGEVVVLTVSIKGFPSGPYSVAIPDTSTISLVDLLKDHQVDPRTADPLPSAPSLGVAIATAQAIAQDAHQVADQASTDATDAKETAADALAQAGAASDAAAGKYTKPADGIPATDLAAGARTSLAAADAALPATELDSATSALLDDDASETKTKLSAAIGAATRGLAVSVTRKIKRAADDVNVLVLSDSTMFYDPAGDKRASRMLCESVAADWPGRAVQWRQWDTTADDWEAFASIQVGSTPTIYWHNGAILGTRMDYFLGSRLDKLRTIQPDLVILNYGLNDGSTDVTGASQFAYQRILTIGQTVRSLCPAAVILVSSQNERNDVTNLVNATRASRYEQASAAAGYGFIDIRQAFADDPRPLASLLNADGLHPNALGSQMICDIFHQTLTYDPAIQAVGRQQLAPLPAAANLVTNGDFSSFASPPTLPGCTVSNATLSKDTTIYESPNGYSVNVAAASAAATFATWTLPKKTVSGQWVTAAARIYVPTGQPSTAGRIALMCGDGADRSANGLSAARDGWFWMTVEKFIPAGSTFAQVRLYADSAANASANIKADRIIVALGRFPRDVR